MSKEFEDTDLKEFSFEDIDLKDICVALDYYLREATCICGDDVAIYCKNCSKKRETKNLKLWLDRFMYFQS